MADIEKFGRTFSFDDNVPDDVRDTRIRNWMQKNAPDELKEKTTPVSPSAAPAQQVGTPIVQSETNTDKSKGNFNPRLAMLSTLLLGPLGPAGLAIPGVRERMGDVNAYRTVAQGAIPFADEITAGARSLAGTPYDTALAEERQGVKDYGQKHGETEKGLLEVAGALGTLPLGMGAAGLAAKAVPGGAKLAALIAKHPFLASIGVGGTSGAVSGFGAGEGGLENRLADAGYGAALGSVLGPAAYGATRAVKKAGDWLKTDNRVAEYLRTVMEREKKLDRTSPTFDADAVGKLRTELADQTALKTEPVVGDLLPGATEQSLQKPGNGSSELAEALYKRQYNKDLPEAVAREQSQFGRLHDAMDSSFGPDTFKGTDEALLAARRANAQQGFTPAYARNVRTPEIDDALDRLNTLSPNILSTAQRWATAERRPIGRLNPDGIPIDYNTQYLHDIKRSMDEVLGEQGRMNPRFNDMPYKNAKSDLNKALMEANPDYKSAMLKYGEDSGLIDALKKGREEVFVPGSVDKTGGMDAAGIKDYLADPNIPQAQKDLFMTAAARTVREKFLGSDAKKFTHNWASFIENPKNEENLNALVNGRQLGSWDLFRSRLKQENVNYQNATRATGNSRTSAREAMKKEAEGIAPDFMSALGLLINPKAPSGWRGVLSTATHAVDPSAAMLNKTASLLAKKGPAANKSLDDIERLLKETADRDARFKRIGAYAPGAVPFALPYRGQD